MIKLSSPCLGEMEKEAVCRVLDSHVINMGKETMEFEKELAVFFNLPTDNVVCVNSCTAALHLSLQSVGVGIGDEVLVSTYTFISTFQAISATGAIPIPVDIDFDDAFINFEDLQRKLTDKTKAIIPVFFAGCGVEKIEKIYDFAKRNNLYVIEDAAHCFGDENISNHRGIICFSFDAIKNITCSDGGCVIAKDHVTANSIRDTRLLGVMGDTDARYKGQRSWNADTTEQGWRYHMSNICAAIGRAQLSRFHEFKQKRQQYSKMYTNGLKSNKNIQLFPINFETAVPHIFPIIVKNGMRNNLKNYLFEREIETGVQYKPNHLLTKFNRKYQLPNAERLYESILCIPLHPKLSEDNINYIIDQINEFLK